MIELDHHVANVGAAHLAERTDSEWLFPGKTAGEPVSSHGLGERLRRHGVTKAARILALHDLTRKIPCTIIVDLIGYNRFLVANRADTLAEPWRSYAAHKSTAPTTAMPTTDVPPVLWTWFVGFGHAPEMKEIPRCHVTTHPNFAAASSI